MNSSVRIKKPFKKNFKNAVLARAGADVHQIRKDIDFNPTIAAVAAASARTRNVIYLVVIVIIGVFVSYRATEEPDWVDARVSMLRDARTCCQKKVVSDSCTIAVNYAANLLSERVPIEYVQQSNQVANSKSFTPLNFEAGGDLAREIENLTSQSSQQLAIHMPVVGLTIDMNDLGIVSSVTFLTLFYIMTSLLRSEKYNLVRASQRIRRMEEPKAQIESLELLLMAQVFSLDRPNQRRWEHIGYLIFVFAIPLVLELFVVAIDNKTFRTGAILEGPFHCWADTIAEDLAYIVLVLVICVAYGCWKSVNESINEMQTLLKELEDRQTTIIEAIPGQAPV